MNVSILSGRLSGHAPGETTEFCGRPRKILAAVELWLIHSGSPTKTA
jgi:hypothetical protein